jgi:maltooligosyltrehalose synthase
MQAAAAAGVHALASLAVDLLRHMHDGRIKQFVIWRTLALRRERETLFRDGAYIPLPTTGEHADHLCTYARVLGEQCAIVIAPRLACTLARWTRSRRPAGMGRYPDVLGLPVQDGRTDALTGPPSRTTASSGLLASARPPAAGCVLVGNGAHR